MNLTKPHLGSILNTISKQIEKKGFESLGLDLLDFFIWFVEIFFQVTYILLIIVFVSLQSENYLDQ